MSDDSKKILQASARRTFPIYIAQEIFPIPTQWDIERRDRLAAHHGLDPDDLILERVDGTMHPPVWCKRRHLCEDLRVSARRLE